MHPKQVYVPKKEVPAVPIEAIKQTSIMINSLEVLVNKIEEPIVIENLVWSTMQNVEIGAAANKWWWSRGQQAEHQILPTKMVPSMFDQNAVV